MEEISQIITSLGFPIAACIALAIFIYKMYTNIQTQNQEREDKLYKMITDYKEQMDKLEDTNANFVSVLEQFKLYNANIENDLDQIKTDISTLRLKYGGDNE